MQLSEAWLREWANPQWDSASLASRLTMAGFEVEGRSPAAPPFSNVVVGEIVECTRHPQADKLSVCSVTTDGKNRLQVVCGASNARAGLRSAVALVGAQLPGGVIIKATRLRDVESNGMLCSARELGLGDEQEGILELPGVTPLGRDLREVLDLDDPILQINVTPNRGDAMSVRGLAREVAALMGTRLAAPARQHAAARIDAHVHIKLSTPKACAKFVARVIRGVDARAHSPLWLRERLRRGGLRAINPIVDVTNYVMLELGTPMHAYDLAQLQGGIDVRLAHRGEKLTLLDGEEISLHSEDLVIADGAGAVGLAGVMGGARTAVTESTREVLFEIAFFTPPVISACARRHGLMSDAAQRFERGVDPRAQEESVERATELLLQIAGGQAGPVTVAAEKSFLPASPTLALRRSHLARLLGAQVPDEEAGRILDSLGMQVRTTSDGWQVVPPSHRFDIAIEADLVEEVGRIYGFDRIAEVDAQIRQRFEALAESRVSVDRALTLLTDRGYFEAITYSFVDPELQRRLFPDIAPLMLSNPIAADLAAMRVSLWPGLIVALRENLRRQHDRVRLFESGRRFLQQAGVLTEIPTLAGLAAGSALPEQWGEKRRAVDFFDVRADVEALLELAGSAHEFSFASDALGCLHPGRSASIRHAGRIVGWVGELHPELVRALDLTYVPVLFELELAAAIEGKLAVFREISRFPSIRRDLAVVVDEGVTLAAIREHVSVGARSLLRDLRVFDVYRGAGVDSGRKSVALGLILQESSRTLTDQDADQIVVAVVDRLRRELNASIRDQ
ncbi:MAG TPA: phenylalanine--tRNA ligase subunit beta [Steroidobacteraceae bacterium]|nr:phenylalanine--tRNA ligase subunit beta [Steroidobacteraceae bacterium]